MSEIQSLARGLKILDLLGQAPDGVSVTELAAILDVDKASASRLISTLAGYGYAVKDPASRRYFLGPQVVTLSRSLLARLPLREAARPFLVRLMQRTGECAHLGVAARGKVLYIDQIESPATLRVNAQVGQTAPLHCTALGKALLAFGDLEIPRLLKAYTPQTLTDPALLRENLEQARRQGYALDQEEYDIGVCCLAVPVYDMNGKAAASIGISGPAARLTSQRLAELAPFVVEIGTELSDRVTLSQP